jgi:AAA15 family ATPase/GTPase
MSIHVTVLTPVLWGDQKLQRNDWGSINFIVGSNGTGKTLFGD